MAKNFVIKGMSVSLSEKDVISAAQRMSGGLTQKVSYYTFVLGDYYPIRQLVIETLKSKGLVVPDIITTQAASIIRSLGYRIIQK